MLEKIALQKNLITQAQCDDALNACRGAENIEIALKDYFVSNNLIPLSQMKQLVSTFHALKIMQKSNMFGRVAVKLGFVKDTVFKAEMNRQKLAVGKKAPPRFIGKLWMEDQTITPDQFQKVLRISKQQIHPPKKQAQEQAGPAETMPDMPRENPSIPAPDSPPSVEDIRKKVPDYSLETQLPGGMILEIDNQGMAAFLRKTERFDDTLSPDEIRDQLLEHDILFGVVAEKNIQGFIRSSGFKEKPFKAASGRLPQPGKDARIEYYFDTDHLKAGGVDKQGNIDFKDRGEVPWVEEGALLAEKFPMSEARNGRNIFDHVIEVPPAIDLPLKFKSGVIQSEDGLKLYAGIGGHPRLSWSGNIQVTDTFVVKKDVDYETGHIEYSGDIEVKGTLKAGFKVKGQSVRINTVDGGDIHAQGDVTIINGVNDARIYTRGNVSAKFIQNSKVFCLGNLSVEKEIVDCTIETSGAVIISSGEVISSQITCNKGLYTQHLGTDRSVPNAITAGVDAFTNDEMRTIQKKIITSEETLEGIRAKTMSLSTEMQALHHSTSRIAHEMDRVREDGGALSEQLAGLEKDSPQAPVLESQIRKNNALFSRLDKDLNKIFDRIEKNENQILDLEVKQEQVEEELEDLLYEQANFGEWQEANPGVPEVLVTGRVSAGTTVSGPKASREITENLTNVKIKEVPSSARDGGKPEIQVHDNIKRR